MAHTTLLQALLQADSTRTDDHVIDYIIEPNSQTGEPGKLLCGERLVALFRDQPIDVNGFGEAYILTIHKKRVLLKFLTQTPWQPTLLKAAVVAHAALGDHVPTWQVLLPGFKTVTQTPDKLIIIRANRGRDVVEAVNGRADCNGRWFTPVSPVSPGFYIELPRDQADLDRLLDAEGYKLDANGYLKV